MAALRRAGQLAINLSLRLVLRGSSPLQSLIDHESQTHRAITQRAVELVEKDGERRVAVQMKRYLNYLHLGSRWADEGWRNTTHFWDPCTRRGLWGLDDAMATCSRFYAAAIDRWQHGDRPAACLALGAASHLMQDLCVPHHTRGTILHGHQRYEKWVEEHVDRFLPRNGDLTPDGIGALAARNAELAYPQLDLVGGQANISSYEQATGLLIPQAVNSTASLLIHFMATVDRPTLLQLSVG